MKNYITNNTDSSISVIYEDDIGRAYCALKNDSVDLKYNYGLKILKWTNVLSTESYDEPKTISAYLQIKQQFTVLNNPEILTSIIVPKSSELIDDYSFFCCMNLSSTCQLSNSNIEYIGYNAFSKCYDIGILENEFNDNLHLPQSLSIIQFAAFSECYRLKNVHIPKKVSHIGKHAFSCCPSLKYLIFDGKTRQDIENMPNYGEWTISSEHVVYIPGIIDGEINIAATNVNAVNSTNSFKPTAKKTFTAQNTNAERKVIIDNSKLAYAYHNNKYDKADLDNMQNILIMGANNDDEYPCLTLADVPCDGVTIIDKPCTCDNPVFKDNPQTQPKSSNPTPPLTPPPDPISNIDTIEETGDPETGNPGITIHHPGGGKPGDWGIGFKGGDFGDNHSGGTIFIGRTF